jgi:hypothetical protein
MHQANPLLNRLQRSRANGYSLVDRILWVVARLDQVCTSNAVDNISQSRISRIQPFDYNCLDYHSKISAGHKSVGTASHHWFKGFLSLYRVIGVLPAMAKESSLRSETKPRQRSQFASHRRSFAGEARWRCDAGGSFARCAVHGGVSTRTEVWHLALPVPTQQRDVRCQRFVLTPSC